jgi:hypothetical protein
MAWTTPKTWAELEVLTSADMNLHVKDNLNVLKTGLGLNMNMEYRTYNSTVSLTSATFVDVHGNLNIASFTPRSASGICEVGLFMYGRSSSAGGTEMVDVDINIDGTRVGNATYGSAIFNSISANTRSPIVYTYFTTLSVAAHTVKPVIRRDGAGTWTLGDSGAGICFVFYIRELGPRVV